MTKSIGAWRSLEARLLWEQEVGGSNPLAPTSLRFNLLNIRRLPRRSLCGGGLYDIQLNEATARHARLHFGATARHASL